MFYTKYRPQKFSQIIKPNDAVDALANEVKNGKTVHAYLFIGPRGTGKTTVARILAKALNCKTPESDGDPCDKCEYCTSIREGFFPDLIEIDAASNRGVDDIRDLKDKVRLAPSRGKRKVYIIDEVHMLTTEAFNALLKTLEEPPKNTVFILCTTESHKVPDTIKSRCQVFKFRRATNTQIINKLKEIAKEEKIKISDDDLRKIAQASLGGFRDAETLFEQVAEGGLDIKTLLSIGSRDAYIEFVDTLLKSQVSKSIKIINGVFEEGVDLNLWAGELMKHLRDLLYVKAGAVEQVEDLTDELVSDIKKQAGQIETNWLVKAIEKLMEAQKNLKSSFIPQLPLEIFAVEMGLKESMGEKENGNNENDTDDEAEQSEEPVATKKSAGKKQREEDDDDDGAGESGYNPVHSKIPEKIKKVIKEQDSKKREETDEEEDAENMGKEENSSGKKNVEEAVVNKNAASAGEPMSIEEIEARWKEVLVKSKDLNHSITALLKAGKIISVEKNTLIFEVSYPFHKERLESSKNRQLIEGLLTEIYGRDVKIKCTLSKEKPKSKKDQEVLTDYNVSIPPLGEGSLLDVFDGGLPAVR